MTSPKRTIRKNSISRPGKQRLNSERNDLEEFMSQADETTTNNKITYEAIIMVGLNIKIDKQKFTKVVQPLIDK